MGRVRVHPVSHALIGFIAVFATAATLVVAAAFPAVAHCPAGEAHGNGGVHRRIDRVMDDADYSHKAGRWTIYEKKGGLTGANRDFDYIRQDRPFERDGSGRRRWVTYPDGTKVTVYPSRSGPPSIQVLRPRHPGTKMRYR